MLEAIGEGYRMSHASVRQNNTNHQHKYTQR